MEASRYNLRKVCPQCGTTVHIRRAVCGCRYAFQAPRVLHFSAFHFVKKMDCIGNGWEPESIQGAEVGGWEDYRWFRTTQSRTTLVM